jgi:spore coat polysaccharide biosynthesis protein SpsF
MKIGAIVQARMSSQRFPGKMLHRIAGKPMQQYLLERLNRCDCLDAIVVATSTNESDAPIADFCYSCGVACYQGSLLNVASRFNEVLDLYGFDGFVRISGDSPLLDQRLIERALEIFVQNDLDLVTNVLKRTYPKGQSVEVLRRETFQAAYKQMGEDSEFEHVTKYFYKNQNDFKIFNFESGYHYGRIQLSVDTPQDMERFATIVAQMNRPHWVYTLDEILEIYWSIT